MTQDKIIHGFEGKYSYLSNFYACQTKYDKTLSHYNMFPTSEHAYQAMKATTLEDADAIAFAGTPDEAKKVAHKVATRKDWDDIKENVMLEIVRSKFENPLLRQRLILTAAEGYEGFCEDNYWHDNFWGNCTCEKCKNIIGQNKLGLTLARVRQEIMDEIQ